MYFFFLFLLSLFLIFNYNFIGNKIKIYDKPDNFRKIHKEPVPLLGGLFLIFITIISIFFDAFLNENKLLSNRETVCFSIGVLFFFLIGLYDDKFGLNPTKKLILSLSCIFIIINLDTELIIRSLLLLNREIQLESFSTIFSILCFLIFINALNMFDGLNGQCSTYSLILCIIFIIHSNYELYLISLIIPLSIFIIINLRGKSFLGDSGSYLLGFILSFFIIKSYNSGESLNSELIFILMYLPGFDLIRLFFIRLKKNKNPFSADKNHIHHIYLKKFSENQSLIIIQLLSFTPFMMTFYIKNFLIVLVSAILLYSIPIYYINKK